MPSTAPASASACRQIHMAHAAESMSPSRLRRGVDAHSGRWQSPRARRGLHCLHCWACRRRDVGRTPKMATAAALILRRQDCSMQRRASYFVAWRKQASARRDTSTRAWCSSCTFSTCSVESAALAALDFKTRAPIPSRRSNPRSQAGEGSEGGADQRTAAWTAAAVKANNETESEQIKLPFQDNRMHRDSPLFDTYICRLSTCQCTPIYFHTDSQTHGFRALDGCFGGNEKKKKKKIRRAI